MRRFFKRRSKREFLDRHIVADVELVRLSILSLPPGCRLHPPNGER